MTTTALLLLLPATPTPTTMLFTSTETELSSAGVMKRRSKLTHVQKHQRNKTSDFLVKINYPQNALRARPVGKARRNWHSLFVICHPSILGWGVWDRVAPSQGGRHRE